MYLLCELMLHFELGKKISIPSHERDVVCVELAIYSVPPLKSEGNKCSDFTQDATPKVRKRTICNWLAIYMP